MSVAELSRLPGARASAAARLPALRRLQNDLHSIVQLKALQDAVDVDPNGIHREAETAGDLGIG